jgi:thiaminase
MDREEFETYLNANSRVVAIFRSHALAYQHSKNRQRATGKRWSETAVASAVGKMVSQLVDNVYDKLKANIKENKFQPYESWVNFIETNEVLDNLEDTVAEMELAD